MHKQIENNSFSFKELIALIPVNSSPSISMALIPVNSSPSISMDPPSILGTRIQGQNHYYWFPYIPPVVYSPCGIFPLWYIPPVVYWLGLAELSCDIADL